MTSFLDHSLTFFLNATRLPSFRAAQWDPRAQNTKAANAQNSLPDPQHSQWALRLRRSPQAARLLSFIKNTSLSRYSPGRVFRLAGRRRAIKNTSFSRYFPGASKKAVRIGLPVLREIAREST